MDQKKPANRTGKTGPQKKPATGKSTAKKPAGGKAGDGLFGWFGRQVGHVKKAVQTDVTKQKQTAKTKPTANSKPRQPKAAGPAPAPADGPTASEKVIFRQDKIEEAELPHQPGVILRRTIIDEVVVERRIGEPADGEPDSR